VLSHTIDYLNHTPYHKFPLLTEDAVSIVGYAAHLHIEKGIRFMSGGIYLI